MQLNTKILHIKYGNILEKFGTKIKYECARYIRPASV
jgi:hypothetical protein